MAILSILFGSLWASSEFQKRFKLTIWILFLNNFSLIFLIFSLKDNQNKRSRNSTDQYRNVNSLDGDNDNETTNKDTNESEPTIDIGYIGILVLFIFVIGILLLLYFYYSYMSKRSFIFKSLSKLISNIYLKYTLSMWFSYSAQPVQYTE